LEILKMNKILKTVLAVGTVATVISSAQAVQIDGFIEFVSDPTKSVSIVGPNLAGATGLDFQAGPNAYIQDTASGDFQVECPGTATFHDFTFGSAVDPVWVLTSGNFSFALDTSTKTVGEIAGITFLNISGTGTVTGVGYDPTPGEFSFTISSANPSRVNFGWQSTTTATPAPDGGATAILLGVGFVGGSWVCGRRRSPSQAPLSRLFQLLFRSERRSASFAFFSF
jgi:hypothetical protein